LLSVLIVFTTILNWVFIRVTKDLSTLMIDQAV
jgi:hypothetical protein